MTAVSPRAAVPPPAGSSEVPSFSELDDQILGTLRRGRLHAAIYSWILRLAVFFGLVAAWQVAAVTGLVKRVLVSDPAAVGSYLWQSIQTRALWLNAWSTFEAVLVSLILGSAVGIAIGLVFYEVPLVRRSMDPFVTFLNSLPRPALAPVFLLWFGLGIGGKVAVAFSVVVFVLLLNTLAGLDTAHEDLIFLSRSLGMSRWDRLYHIQLPSAAPAIVAGLRLGSVYAVLGVVVSELVAAYSGLGQALTSETNKFDIAGAFGILVIIGLLASAIDRAISLLERRVSPESKQRNKS